MATNENICGQRIVYDNHSHEKFSEPEANLHDKATCEVENILAILTEIQTGRMNSMGEIAEPLTTTQIATIMEVFHPMLRSLAVLEAIEGLHEDL